MTVFQLFLVLGIVAVAALALSFLRGERPLAIQRIFAILAALAAILAILFPEALTVVANFFGIGRGADLLLYVSVIGGLLCAVATVRTKARGDARVTQLARSVALMEARLLERHELTSNTSDESEESA